MIIKQYFAEAQGFLEQKNFDGARSKYRQIMAGYTGTEFAQQAEAALPAIGPLAVAYYQSEGEKNFQPTAAGQFMQPQDKAAEDYARMYAECRSDDSLAGQADFALLQWSRALGTQGKTDQAIGNLQQLLREHPFSEQAAQAKFQLGFLLGSNSQRQYKEAVTWMQKVWTDHPGTEQAASALWHAAFYQAWQGSYADGLPYLEKLQQEYSTSPRAQFAAQWIETFKQRINQPESS